MVLNDFICNWKYIGTNDTVLQWLEQGVRIPFDYNLTPFELPNHQFSVKETQLIDSEI
jgi:hypothetical protein